jgi:acetylornithine deacetylase/succinyl-diaminopimelate desuccinylase-like protein
MSEAAELLQRLIRLDTTNPPGNETLAATLLRDYLEVAGVECHLYARVPERANLVARIPGRGSGPTLALLSHTDVVLADAGAWEQDPFGGELVGDEIWGRGALDMKGEVAASAVALATLAREGWRGDGDLIFVAAADEEVGAGFGLQWLVEEHPDAVRADFSVNEGAGDRIELGGKVLYLCATAEKMSSPFELRVHGRSGHAAMPSIADNALVKAAPLVERLGAFQAEPRLIPEVEGFLAALLGEVPSAPDALARAREIAPLAGELIEPLLAMTVAPTKAHASDKRNVIPALCEITVDTRLLPGQTPEEAEAAIRVWLGEGDYDLVNTERFGGTRSPIEGPLWDAV